MTVRALKCVSCGGAIAHPAGSATPICLFCGRSELVPLDVPETVEAPQSWLGFAVDEAAARSAFRGWAGSRFWAPGAIRTAKVELSQLFLPAWVWEGRLETHWTGLTRAMTRSGKRPVTGQEEQELRGVLVPSSPTLTAKELAAISPFNESDARSNDGDLPAPHEVGLLTRSVARSRGVREMEAAHAAQIRAARDLVSIKTSSLVLRAEGRPVLLPIWIGAYLHGDDSYRVVINGQSGATTGTAPISWFKVAAAVLLGFFVLLFVLGVLAGQ